MATVTVELVLCSCCALAAANDDYSGCGDLDDAQHPVRVREHPLGILGADLPGLVVGDDWDDFSARECGGCGTTLAGSRVSAALLSD